MDILLALKVSDKQIEEVDKQRLEKRQKMKRNTDYGYFDDEEEHR